ncbi:hypothetical protein [Phaeodactylibacter luteus]|uniref:hypothetical protein n=1 Tax=Phaeodactylibacter luteus TaxID=1564516 RepID=UPI001479462B|nr:hypothetical protein [Phaeodactylibacter luteus]
MLLTRFLSETGMVELTGYMPVPATEAGCALVRTLRCIRGGLKFRMACEPRFDYARPRPVVEQESEREARLCPPGEAYGLWLLAEVPIQAVDGQGVEAVLEIK